MREIKYIVLHCTATPQSTTIASIQNYWRKTRGWRAAGYHFIIKADGEVRQLTPIEEVANGVKGYNAHAIHISYIGGIDDKDYDGDGNKSEALDNRTPKQIARQIELLNHFKKEFPHAEIKGHRDFPNVHKACPSFDVETWINSVKEQLTFKI